MASPLFSLETEQAVIGGVFVSPVAFSDVADRVDESDFHDARHRSAWRAMAALSAKNMAVDLVTVAEQLEAAGELAAVGWSYLAALAQDTPSAANILAHADLIRSRAIRRRLVELGGQLQTWARDGNAERARSALDRALADLDARRAGTTERLLGEFLAPLLDRLDRMQAGETVAPPALPTGLRDLDALLNGGMRAGRLVVVAGRPGMGKSVLGLQCAAECALRASRPALVFSLEMTGDELAERQLAASADVPMAVFQTGGPSESEWARLIDASGRLGTVPIWIDDSPGITLDALQSRARRLHRKSPLGLVVVDHIGLMTAGRLENRQQEIAAIARELKNLAKELACPVLALCQLNRGVEQRQDKRPLLSDLRESGEIEQSADIVLCVYRDEVYNPDSPDAGCAELLLRKHRGGKTGMVPVAFVGDRAKFGDLDGKLPSASISRGRPEVGIDF